MRSADGAAMTSTALAVSEAVTRWGRPALAWEVLRRDPAYRASYASLPSIPGAGEAATADFVARWGLHFP